MTESAHESVKLLENERTSFTERRSSVERSQFAEALMDVVFGSAAGMIGKIFEYPFDTVKVRLQSQPDGSALRYSGPLDCFRKSLQEGGLRGLYKGISAPMVGAALETSSLFFSYRLAQDAYRAYTVTNSADGPLPLGTLILCGAVSGAFTSIVLTPVELVKCQLQVATPEVNQFRHGPLSIITSIYSHHGIKGFWRGQTGTLIRETGGSAAWFGSYEGVTALFRKAREDTERSGTDNVPVGQQLIAGASAGMCYNFMFYPADTIKSRMQTEEVSQQYRPTGKHRTFLTVARDLWHQQGIRGMYRGCGITVARSAPSSALIFTIYEGLRGFFDEKHI